METVRALYFQSHVPPQFWGECVLCAAYLSDFICNNLVSFDTLPNASQVFLAKQSQWHEPKSYQDAASDPVWQEKMEKELQALHSNNTWDLVLLLSGKKSETLIRWQFRTT